MYLLETIIHHHNELLNWWGYIITMSQISNFPDHHCVPDSVKTRLGMYITEPTICFCGHNPKAWHILLTWALKKFLQNLKVAENLLNTSYNCHRLSSFIVTRIYGQNSFLVYLHMTSVKFYKGLICLNIAYKCNLNAQRPNNNHQSVSKSWGIQTTGFRPTEAEWLWERTPTVHGVGTGAYNSTALQNSWKPTKRWILQSKMKLSALWFQGYSYSIVLHVHRKWKGNMDKYCNQCFTIQLVFLRGLTY